jgi:hypothetical protein
MKRWLTPILWLMLTASAFSTTLTGSIKYPSGRGVTGMLQLTLSHPAHSVAAPAVVVPSLVQFRLTNGALPSLAVVIGNDDLTPTHTYYWVEIIDAYGSLVSRAPYYISGITYDMGAAKPTTITTNNLSFADLSSLAPPVGTTDTEWFNVKAYGALGNGIANDTPHIQDAIDAAEASTRPGTVYFPKGDYLVFSTLTVNKPLTIWGSGSGGEEGVVGGNSLAGTRLLWKGVIGGTMLKLNEGANPIQGITVRDIFLDGGYTENGAGGAAGVGMNLRGIAFSQFTNMRINDYNGIGLKLETLPTGAVRHCYFNLCYIEGYGQAITSNEIYDPAYAGVPQRWASIFHNVFNEMVIGYSGDKPGVEIRGDTNDFLMLSIARTFFHSDGTVSRGYGVQIGSSNDEICGNQTFFNLEASEGGLHVGSFIPYFSGTGLNNMRAGGTCPSDACTDTVAGHPYKYMIEIVATPGTADTFRWRRKTDHDGLANYDTGYGAWHTTRSIIGDIKDIVTVAPWTTITSATAAFTAAMVGSYVNIYDVSNDGTVLTGLNFHYLKGRYKIITYNAANSVTLDRACANADSANGTGIFEQFLQEDVGTIAADGITIQFMTRIGHTIADRWEVELRPTSAIQVYGNHRNNQQPAVVTDERSEATYFNGARGAINLELETPSGRNLPVLQLKTTDAAYNATADSAYSTDDKGLRIISSGTGDSRRLINGYSNGTSMWQLRAEEGVYSIERQANIVPRDVRVFHMQNTYPTLSVSDLASVSPWTTVTSVTGGFTAAMVGGTLKIETGVNFTPGDYVIASYVSTNSVVLKTVCGSVGNATGGHADVLQNHENAYMEGSSQRFQPMLSIKATSSATPHAAASVGFLLDFDKAHVNSDIFNIKFNGTTRLAVMGTGNTRVNEAMFESVRTTDVIHATFTGTSTRDTPMLYLYAPAGAASAGVGNSGILLDYLNANAASTLINLKVAAATMFNVTGDGSIYTVGTKGLAAFGPAAPASITVKNGLITAAAEPAPEVNPYIQIPLLRAEIENLKAQVAALMILMNKTPEK